MIKHNKISLGIEEVEAGRRVIASGWLAEGREVSSFENEFCNFLNIPHGHAVAVSSGTSALYLSLWALDAKDKIISFPAYSCAAIRNAVGLIMGKELLIDNAIDSPNIDIQQLNFSCSKIAIIPHTYGIPVAIGDFKTKMIIEDCCQALGAKINDINVGLIGEIGVFSFYATKLITSGGQGGIVVSKNKDIVDKIRDYREFDQRKDSMKRFNFQMTDLQAAIGRVQLLKFPSFIERRAILFQKYMDAGIPLLTESDIKILTSVRYRAIIRTDHAKAIQKYLSDNGIKTIIPLEDWELLGDKNSFPNAHKMTQTTLSLPLYPSLSDDEIDFIIRHLKTIV